jgi:hypothetical protein
MTTIKSLPPVDLQIPVLIKGLEKAGLPEE